MNFRFRKSIPIIGKLLRFTVSKKGVSLNLRLGWLSKSWGTRGTSTTLDMPGTSGMFFRKERRRSAKKLDPAAAALLRRQRSAQAGQILGAIIIAVVALVELGRLHIHIGESCTLGGHPHITLGVLVAAQITVLRALRQKGVLLVFAATVAVAVVQWKLFGALAMPNVHCA